MCRPPGRWVVPPLAGHATQAERRRRRQEIVYNKQEIRWIWNEICSGFHFTRRVVPTGTVSFEPPPIGQIELGPPTVFTVRLRPGQVADDFRATGDRLAAAYDVAAVAVRPLAPGWIVVELIDDVDVGRPDRVQPAVGHSTTLPTTPDADTRTHHRVTSSNPLGRRHDRGPSGGPRRLR